MKLNDEIKQMKKRTARTGGIMQNKYNIYNFIKFPNKKIRDKAKREYFDTSSLRYSLKKYNDNLNQNDNIKVTGLNEWLNFDEEIKKDFRELIRKINNQLFSCNVAILRMYNYYETLNLDTVKSDNDMFKVIELLYRRECVNLSFEIFNIIEKMKTILRTLYKLNLKQTKRNDDLMKVFNDIAKTDDNLLEFLLLSKELCKMDSYKLLNDLRDAEVHNAPMIDEVTWFKELQDGVRVELVMPLYKISNEELYSGIKQVLDKLKDIKNSIQKIIDSYKGDK